MPFSATRDLWLVLKARDEGARAMRSFSRDIRMVGDSVHEANLRASKSALLNQLAIQRLTGATQDDILATHRQIQAIDQQLSKEHLHRAALEERRVALQRMSSTMTGLSATAAALGTGLIAAGIFGSIGMHSLVESAIEYQKQAALTRTQVDKFRYSLEQIKDVGIRVANTVGVPFEQIQPALFDIFSSMEIGLKDAEKLLVVFSKAAVAGQTDIQSAARATIGILNAFQLPLSSVSHLMDLQFQLVQEGVGTYEEWAQRIGLVTPSAARAGQSVEMMVAALAATTRLGISAARAGTAVARAMDAMSNPKTVTALKKLGVNALDAKGNFRPLIDVLGEFRTVLMKLPKGERIATLLDVFKGAGGTIEARRFLQNMLLTPGDLELFKSIFDEMSKEAGSFEKAYGVMADTAATKSELIANKWAAFKIKAGELLIPTFLRIIDFLGRMLDWFAKLDPKMQRFIVISLAVGAGLSVALGIILLIVAGFLALAAAIATAGVAVGVLLLVFTGIGTAFAAFTTAVGLAWAKSDGFREAVKKLGERLKIFWQEHVVPTAQQIRDAWEKTVKPALDNLKRTIEEKVLPPLEKMWSTFESKIKPALIEIGNTIKDVAIDAYQKFADLLNGYVIPVIEKASKFYDAHKKTIDEVIAVIVEMTKWVLKLVIILGGFFVGMMLGPVARSLVAFIGLILMIIGLFIKWIEFIQGIIAGLRKVGQALSDWWNETKRKFKKIGTDIVDSIVEGIKEMIPNFLSTLGSMASLGIRKIKENLGIGSPSKVFMTIGKQTMQGYILGIRNSMPAVKSQMTNTTAGLTSAVAPSPKGSGFGTSQNITINTQEINPRRHAAELGWLLGGRSS